MDELLALRDSKPLVVGTHRAVYEVSGEDQLLVKVMLPGPGKRHGWIKVLKEELKVRLRYGRHRFLFREYAGYIRTWLNQRQQHLAPPIADLRGFIVTDLGLGMLAEKICGPDGELGEQLHGLHRSGRLAMHLPLLNQFARSLFEWNVVANDINPGNVVLGERHGKLQFVLVDGLGESYLIPVRNWFQWANRRSLNKRLRRTAASCGLQWDSKLRTFTVAAQRVPPQ